MSMGFVNDNIVNSGCFFVKCYSSRTNNGIILESNYMDTLFFLGVSFSPMGQP